MSEIRLPVLLGSPTDELAEKALLHPVKESIRIPMEGTGETSMTLREDESIPMHAWVKVYNALGFVGIYRRTSRNHVVKNSHSYTLMHGIDILQDSIWEEETTFEGTVADYIAAILNKQTHLINNVKPWAAGTCANGNIRREIKYNKLSDLLSGIIEEGGGYYFTYDQTSFPWTVNLVAKSNSVESEFRLSRNVEKCTIKDNDAEMCTRLVLNYNHPEYDASVGVQQNVSSWKVYNNIYAQAVYGIITKTEDIDVTSEAEADEWAAGYLARRSEPLLQIEIDGIVLKGYTGDTWDESRIGALVRVALPEYAQAIEERCVTITYPEVYAKPDRITVSLANALPKFTNTVNRVSSAASSAQKSSRSSKRAETDFQKHFKITDDAGNILRQAGMTLNANGMLVYADDQVNMVGSRFNVQADQIGMAVGKIAIDPTRITEYQNYNAFKDITGTSGYFAKDLSTNTIYTWKDGHWVKLNVDADGANGYWVKAGDIAIAINESGETEAHIDAQKVILGQANLTADDLATWAADPSKTKGVFAKFLTVSSLTAQEVKTQIIDVIENAILGGLNVNNEDGDPIEVTGGAWIGGAVSVEGGLYVSSSGSAQDPIEVNIADIKVNGNTMTIYYLDGTTETFNKAVAAMINAGSWNGGVLQINATPGTANYKVGFGSSVTADMKLVLVGDGLHPVSHESNEKFLYLPVKVQQKDDSTTPPTFSDVYGWENLIIDCTEVWNNGRLSVAPVTPQLSGAWNTGTHVLTVQSTPSAVANYTVGFGGSYNAHSTELQVVKGEGNPTYSAGVINVPISVDELQSGSTAPIPVYTKSLPVTVTALLESKTGDNKVTLAANETTKNITVTPGKIGMTAVDIDASLVYQAGETAGTTAGTTAGKNAVGLGNWSWNEFSGQVIPDHRTLEISTTGKVTGTDVKKTKTLYLTEGIHATGKIRVMLQDDTGTGRINVARLEVNAYLPADYQAALATVPSGYVTNVTISPSQDVELAPSGGITAEQTVTVTATDGSGNSTTIGSVKISASGYNATEYEQHAKDTAESAALKFIDWGSVSDDDHPITDLYPGSTVAVQYGPEGSEIELAGQRFYVPESSSDPITWADTLSGTSEKRFAYITHGDETKSYRIAYNTGWKNAGGKTRTAVEVRARAAASRSDASTGDSDPVVARMDIQGYLNNARNAGGQSASIQDLGAGKGTTNILTPGHTYGVQYMNDAGSMVWCDSWGYVEDNYQAGYDAGYAAGGGGSGGDSHSPSIAGTDIWTTDHTQSGWIKADTLRDKFYRAKADSEYVCFTVKCGNGSQTYYMEP